MLINNVKLGKSIEQKIKLRILYSIILLILGGVSLYVGTCVPLASGNGHLMIFLHDPLFILSIIRSFRQPGGQVKSRPPSK